MYLTFSERFMRGIKPVSSVSSTGWIGIQLLSSSLYNCISLIFILVNLLTSPAIVAQKSSTGLKVKDSSSEFGLAH